MMAAMLAAVGMAGADILPVSYRNVTIDDGFWAPRQKALDTHTIRHQFQMLEKHGYRSNFERAAALQRGGYIGLLFNDSDVYKVIEAGAYVLGRRKNPALEKIIDGWIDLIARAQEADGYLNTWFQLERPDKKWTNLRDEHELYCLGHLYEAAAAHFEATGKRTLLEVAIKSADQIHALFNQREGYCGHPEVELALFKLADATKNPKYAELSALFIERRGGKFFAKEHGTPLREYTGDYAQDNAPIREHSEIVGHAVRAAYLFTGAADYARQTRDPAMIAMLDRVWKNTVERRMFVTGGLGPSGSNEGFTVDYDLPTFTAYQESCASIANVLWNQRLVLLHEEAKYVDVLETALYNGTLAGINVRGNRYFYVNPLASNGNHDRPEWHACACCPPNLARVLGQVGGLIYAADKDAIYVNLFANSQANVDVAGHDAVLRVTTDYPWDGKVTVEILEAKRAKFALKLRAPGWLTESPRLDGKPVIPDAKGFVTVARTWKAGERVVYELPMPVRRVASHPSVRATAGMFALARGPLIYCLEGVDNAVDLDSLGVPPTAAFRTRRVQLPMGKVTVLDGTGHENGSMEWAGRLFQTLAAPREFKLRAIPYALWNNRGPSPMRVWLSPVPPPAPLRGYERDATVELSHTSRNCDPTGANDGFVPETSNPNSPRQTHFWPRKGGEEWVAYRLAKPATVSSARVYWFDDTGRGECKVPKGWRLEAWVSGNWQAVQLEQGQTYSLALDRWVEVRFRPVASERFRLVITQQDGWSSGLHEWQLF